MTKKFALLIGINYRNSSLELNGCINDAENLGKCLREHFGYTDITLMTDKSIIKPTKINIISKLSRFIAKANREKADEIWISYSGHGTHTYDHSNDEKDKQDELIVPLDYSKRGCISDDQLNKILSGLNQNCRCICLFDCCHSGTILDLKYRYLGNNVEENKTCNIKAKCLMISGCLDTQTSADAYLDKTWKGAMTTAFLAVIEKNYDSITCLELVEKMRDFLKKKRFSQVPQLTSSIKLTKHSLFCLSENNQPFIEKSGI